MMKNQKYKLNQINMILTDTDIKTALRDKKMKITPFNPARLGSNSYDLTLSKHLMIYKRSQILDCAKDNPTETFTIPEDGLTLYPGELYLGSTNESTQVGDFMPWIEGKSSTGRLGISVHITAGFGDIGFRGHWTLEITVVKPIIIYADMPIAQIAFMLPLGTCSVPYYMKAGASYNDQPSTPQPSKMFKNFQNDTKVHN